jgi:hypothetical protein
MTFEDPKGQNPSLEELTLDKDLKEKLDLLND